MLKCLCLFLQAMYCTEECRSSSWNNSHSIDCSLLPTLLQFGCIETILVPLKIVIMVCKNMDFEDTLASLKAEESLKPEKRGFDNEGHYSSSNYSPIYWLECNMDKISFANLFVKCVTAAFLLYFLESMTDLFSDFDIKNFKYEIGGLLLRHLMIASCNSSAVLELKNTNDMTLGVMSRNEYAIGIAVYATGSLLNHSCFANVQRVNFSGDSLAVCAYRTISAGEQVIYHNTKNI